MKSIAVAGGEAAHELGGFGRTVFQLHDDQEEEWLRDRNPLLRVLRLRGGMQGRVVIFRLAMPRAREGSLRHRAKISDQWGKVCLLVVWMSDVKLATNLRTSQAEGQCI